MAIDEHPFDRLERLLRERGAAIRQVRPGQKIRATCPVHSDHKPSLLITRGDRGALLHCFARCKTIDILAALGLRMADLFAGPHAGPKRPAIIATYPYTNASGEVIARKHRTADKGFWWERPDAGARSGWRTGLAGVAEPPSLYRRTGLEGASLVFVVEGEKAADRLHDLGLVATCGHVGVNTWRGSGVLVDAILPTAVVAILPDHDRPGERHAERVAADILAHRGGTSIVLKVVPLPELPAGGDVFDWLDAGHALDELLDRVEASPVWSPGAADLRRRLHRRCVERDRKRQWRQNRRVIAATPEPPNHRSDLEHGWENRVAAAFDAVLEKLHRAANPMDGRGLKVLLTGQHSRHVVDEALKRGREAGILAYERGPHRSWLYRVLPLAEAAPYIHRGTAPSRHCASVSAADAARDTGTAETPMSIGQNAVSRARVPLSRVPSGERSLLPLQENSPVPLNTPWDIEVRDTGIKQSRDTDTGVGQRLEVNGHAGRGEVSGAITAPAVITATTRMVTAALSVTRQDVAGGTGPDNQAHAIAQGRCCGHAPGSQLRCQLCRWSPTYSGALRMLRKAGRGAFDERDRSALGALQGSGTA